MLTRSAVATSDNRCPQCRCRRSRRPERSTVFRRRPGRTAASESRPTTPRTRWRSNKTRPQRLHRTRPPPAESYNTARSSRVGRRPRSAARTARYRPSPRPSRCRHRNRAWPRPGWPPHCRSCTRRRRDTPRRPASVPGLPCARCSCRDPGRKARARQFRHDRAIRRRRGLAHVGARAIREAPRVTAPWTRTQAGVV
jgi:hypothetical protein